MKGGGEPFPCILVAWDPESQPVRSVCERAGEDSRDEEPFKSGARVGMRGQPKEASSADDLPASAVQEGVELRCLAAETDARRFQPICIGEHADPDCDRRTADGPRAKGGAQGRNDVRRGKRETEPQSGQSVGFAE